MAKRSVIHVTPHEKGWQVKQEGAQRAGSVHPTKQEAVDAAVNRAKSGPPSQVKIHKKDGTIQSERTYGQDPHPPKG